jgi:hypothetical protein
MGSFKQVGLKAKKKGGDIEEAEKISKKRSNSKKRNKQ